MKAVTISDEVKRKFPNVRIANITYKINNYAGMELLQKYLNDASDTISPTDEIQNMSSLMDTREAIKVFGINPSKYRGSAEALIRRVQKEGRLKSINPVVDINNIISIKYKIPVGSYNESAITGNPMLDIGQAGEVYDSLKKENFSVTNMLILRDSTSPFGSIHADSLRTMIDNSSDVFTVLFSFSEDERLLIEAMEEYLSLLNGFCNISVKDVYYAT